MGDAIVQSFPIAIGLIVVSMPVAVVVLILVAAGDHRGVTGFLSGWIVGIVALSALAVAVVDVSTAETDDDRSLWANVLRIVVGVLVLALAAKNWAGRPTGDAELPTPTWMSAFESITPRKAALLSFAMITANPKNAVVVVSGATTIAAASEVVIDQVVAVVVFAVIGTLGVAAPAIAQLLFRDRATSALDAIRDRMIKHNNSIMAVVLAVIGAILVINGIVEL